MAEVKIGKSYHEQKREEEKKQRQAVLQMDAARVRPSNLLADKDVKGNDSGSAAGGRNLQSEEVSGSNTSELPLRDGIKEKARLLVVQKWGEDQWPYFDKIVTHESGWNPNARNPSSGACGLPQALPGSKMGGMDVDNQLRWMLAYVEGRYGTPSNAWAFWQSHNWY